MEMPPPPPGMPANQTQRKSKTWIWILVGVAGVCGLGTVILAAILFPVFAQARFAAMKTKTVSDAKFLALAAFMYSEENDDRFPNSQDWETSLAPFIKDPEIITPKITTVNKLPARFAMNKGISGKKQADIENPANTPLFFLSTLPGPSASGGFAEVAQLQTNLAVIAFTDTSVKIPRGESLATYDWEIKPKPKN